MQHLLNPTTICSVCLQVPSHWMEYFARCPSTVAKWARHYITGEVVPHQLLLQALEGSAVLPAVDLQVQILYSAVDQVQRVFFTSGLCWEILSLIVFIFCSFQYVFGTGIGDVSSLSHKDIFERANLGIRDVQEKYTALPPGQLSSMNLLNHGHLVNYGGTHHNITCMFYCRILVFIALLREPGAYYAYLFAHLYSAQIWHKHFATDPLNR